MLSTPIVSGKSYLITALITPYLYDLQLLPHKMFLLFKLLYVIFAIAKYILKIIEEEALVLLSLFIWYFNNNQESIITIKLI